MLFLGFGVVKGRAVDNSVILGPRRESLAILEVGVTERKTV